MCGFSAIRRGGCCCAASRSRWIWARCCAAAAELGVAVEHNAAPERLDLNDRDLRLAKELGCKIMINTDSHDSRNLGKMDYGIRQLRRAWLGPEDVLNTLEAEDFLAALRLRP